MCAATPDTNGMGMVNDQKKDAARFNAQTANAPTTTGT
jgi:hypothetical protein